MKREGWLGLFGNPMLSSTKNRERYFYLKSMLANRHPRTCESMLQKSAGKNLTTFEAHIAVLLGENVTEIQKIKDGAQIILRKKARGHNNIFLENSLHSNILEKYSVPTRLSQEGFTVTQYENTKHNAELLRIRSDKGIMESHGVLNAIGEKISSTLFKK